MIKSMKIISTRRETQERIEKNIGEREEKILNLYLCKVSIVIENFLFDHLL